MNKSPHINKIVIIVFLVIIITLILYMLSTNYFFSSGTQTNEILQYSEKSINLNNLNKDDDRVYLIIYDENDDLSVIIKNNVERVLKILKLKYYLKEINELNNTDNIDVIILTAKKWINYTEIIDNILNEVKEGTNLMITTMPGEDSFFISQQQKFGIFEIGDPRINKNLKVSEKIVLGLEVGDEFNSELVEDYIYSIHIIDDADVYLSDENDKPVYYTVEYGSGEIGVFNGENFSKRYYDGVIVGALGAFDNDFAYPVIGASVFFLDDWPAPFILKDKDIFDQYGLNYNDFLRYIWWPDILALIEKHDVKFAGALLLEYNNIQVPPFDISQSVLSGDMYNHYQQMLSRGGEVGIHGYNHMPLWFSEYYDVELKGEYLPWRNKEYATKALKYTINKFEAAFPNYKVNFYVPPSNIIDDIGVEVVKEALGVPVIISGSYNGSPPQEKHQSFELKDDVIYFPRFTYGSIFSENVKFLMSMGATSHGVISHFIHPDDIINTERSEGLSWEEMREGYETLFSYVDQKYSFLEYRTVTESANRTVDWYNSDYSIIYANDYIKISSENIEGDFSMILKTNKNIIKGDGYKFEKIDNKTYYITLNSSQVVINFEEKN